MNTHIVNIPNRIPPSTAAVITMLLDDLIQRSRSAQRFQIYPHDQFYLSIPIGPAMGCGNCEARRGLSGSSSGSIGDSQGILVKASLVRALVTIGCSTIRRPTKINVKT